MSQIVNVVTIYSFVPYVGIVTILMNDYPKFKVFYLFSFLSTISYIFFSLNSTLCLVSWPFLYLSTGNECAYLSIYIFLFIISHLLCSCLHKQHTNKINGQRSHF